MTWTPSEIFFFEFNQFDLEICSLVSKTWNKFANDDCLWIKLVPGIKEVVGKNFSSYIKSHRVRSLNELINRFAESLDKIPTGGSLTFSCFFPFNPGCRFDAKVRFTYDWTGLAPELKEQWIFMRALQSDGKGNDQFIQDFGSFPTMLSSIRENIGLDDDLFSTSATGHLHSDTVLPKDVGEDSPQCFRARIIHSDVGIWNRNEDLMMFDGDFSSQMKYRYLEKRQGILNQTAQRNRVICRCAAVALLAYGALLLT